MDKKGQGIFNSLTSIAIGIGGFVVVVTVLFLLLAETKDTIDTGDFCTGGTTFNESTEACHNATDGSNVVTANLSAAWNSTTTMQGASQILPDWAGILIITALGVVALGLLTRLGLGR